MTGSVTVSKERKKLTYLSGAAVARLDFVLHTYSTVLPTTVIAKLFDISETSVRRRGCQVGSSVEANFGRALRRTFLQAEKLPDLPGLSSVERNQIAKIKDTLNAKKEQQATLKARRSAEAILASLREARAVTRAKKKGIPEVLCHGSCGEHWPRLPTFFRRARTTTDGLTWKCKYCIARQDRARHIQRRRGLRAGPVRHQTTLTGPPRKRAVELVKLHANRIPGRIFQEFFDVSATTITQLRKEAKVTVSNRLGRNLYYAWAYRKDMPNVPGLTAKEKARLKSLHQKLYLQHQGYFAPIDRLLLRRMDTVRREAGDQPLRQCKSDECRERYPLDTRCFEPFSNGKLDSYCRLCRRKKDRAQTQERFFRRFEEQYGWR
ncbi:MAG: hypothetical protein KDD69_09775 [Bdellovibrionales bacterium]|nr:hypothetical protein [Bdellovibrionales bacterium]